MITLALMTGMSGPASAAQEGRLAWDHSTSKRFYIETQVRLPLISWWATKFNKQARVSAYDLRLVTRCAPGIPDHKRSVEVMCTLDDVALQAAGLPQEAGLLEPIIAELDARLTGSVVQLQIRNDGQLMDIDVEELDRRNRRVGRMNENLRLTLARAFAGLDLTLDDSRQWVQANPWLMKAPDAMGSAGGMEVIHQVNHREGGITAIETGGRGTIIPGDGLNIYDARIVGSATFDSDLGQLLERTWTVIGSPTASSRIAQGTAGYPYVQHGRLVALSPDQAWDVGDSGEIAPSDFSPSAIQQHDILGTRP